MSHILPTFASYFMLFLAFFGFYLLWRDWHRQGIFKWIGDWFWLDHRCCNVCGWRVSFSRNRARRFKPENEWFHGGCGGKLEKEDKSN